MEEFVIAGKPVLILSKQEVDAEIEQAKLDQRDANFAGKTLKAFSLMGKDLDNGVNLENSLIIGNVFFGDCSIKGNLNLAGTAIDGSLNFSHGKLIGNLLMEKAWIGQTANMAGINITGSVAMAQARVNGFVSFSQAVILGNLDLRQIESQDYCQNDLKIKGDIILKSAQINGALDLSGAQITGDIIIDNALVRQNLITRDTQTQGIISLKDAIYNKGLADFTNVAPEKIIQ